MQYAPQHDAAPSGPTRLVMPLANLQDRPVEVDCPYCRRVTMTRVEEHSSGMTMYVYDPFFLTPWNEGST